MSNSSYKKKLGFIINSLGVGGSERVFLNLLNNLDRNKYILKLYVFRKIDNNDYIELLNNDVEINYINGIDNLKMLSKIKTLFRIFQLRKKIIKDNQDLYIVTGTYLNQILTKVLPKSILKKMILRAANIPGMEANNFSDNYTCYNNVERVISQSDDMSKALINHGVIGSKITKINNMIDLELIEKKLEENLEIELDKNTKNIVAVGRLVDQKNYMALIEAFKHLKKTDIKLYILGDGELRESLEKKVDQYGLGNNLYFLGRQSNPYKYMREADLFVLSSKYEGFPNVLLEAGACGTYALVNNCPGGINEIVEERLNGSIVDFNNSKLVAEKIMSLVNLKPDESKIKDFILSKYHINKIVKKYEEVFDSL